MNFIAAFNDFDNLIIIDSIIVVHFIKMKKKKTLNCP